MAPFLPLEESTTDQIINYRDDIPKPVLQKQTVVDGKVKVEKEPPAATLRRTCVDDKGVRELHLAVGLRAKVNGFVGKQK